MLRYAIRDQAATTHTVCSHSSRRTAGNFTKDFRGQRRWRGEGWEERGRSCWLIEKLQSALVGLPPDSLILHFHAKKRKLFGLCAGTCVCERGVCVCVREGCVCLDIVVKLMASRVIQQLDRVFDSSPPHPPPALRPLLRAAEIVAKRFFLQALSFADLKTLQLVYQPVDF